jgi:uncharacterized protein
MNGALRFGLALILASTALFASQTPVPELWARVTDLTATLTPTQRDSLERKLQTFEQNIGSQIAVLLVPTSGDETIESYAIRVAETWKIGRANADDGVILIIAKDDRELRIEVGYGLEGAVPDALAKQIIDEHIVPRFRSGDFFGGIDAGVDALIAAVSGEPLPPPDASLAEYGEGMPPIAVFSIVYSFVILAFIFVVIFYRVWIPTLIMAGLSFFGGWIVLGTAEEGMIFAFVSAGLGLIFGFFKWAGSKGGGSSSYSSSYSSGYSSSSYSSSSYSSSSFSGGGGSFGGGGASGSW